MRNSCVQLSAGSLCVSWRTPPLALAGNEKATTLALGSGKTHWVLSSHRHSLLWRCPSLPTSTSPNQAPAWPNQEMQC